MINRISHKKLVLHIFILIIFFCLTGFAKGIDEKLPGKSHKSGNGSSMDTAMINLMNRKAFQYRRTMPDSAKMLAHKALQLSDQIVYNKGKGDAFIALGYTHLVNFSPNDSAEQCMNAGYEIFKGIDDKRGMGLACFGLGYVYSFRGNMKKAEEYSRKSLGYYTAVADKRGMFNAANSLSYIYKQFKEYDKSFELIYRAIDYATDLKDTALIADGYNNLGNIYKDQALFQQAIDNYFNALEMWESKRDSTGMAIAYGSIGNMYYFQQNIEKALEYYKRKLPISLKSGNNWEVSKTYNSIAGIYNSAGQHEIALEYLNKSLQINNFMNYPIGIADAYYKLADTYYLMGMLDSASTYINHCLHIARKTDVEAALASYYILKGKIQLSQRNDQSALDHILQGYNTGKELGIPFAISEASDLLRRIYASRGRNDLAYKYLLEFKQMQDSINKEENIKKLTRLEIQYEFDKKKQSLELEKEQERKKHAEEMKLQQMYLLIIIGVALLTIISIIFIIKQKNTRAKYKTIALEQKLLRTQMDPHFIFNSLCAIQEFVIDNKPREASRFLSRFSGLMRSILENSRNDFVLLENEIATLKNYLEIQKLRFEMDFDYSIEIDPSIDSNTYTIPPMLAQPFIENSVEHGLLPKKDKGKIEIRYSLNNGLITIEIKDNGIGRKESFLSKTEKQKSRQSLATIVTMERIAYLKKTVNKHCRFEIFDIDNNGNIGTGVIIQIPYRMSLG